MGTVSGHGVSLEDLVTRFQSASESLERSYRELQGRVQSLTAELEREREERIRLERLAAMGEMAMELAHEIRNPLGSIEPMRRCSKASSPNRSYGVFVC